MKKYIFVLITIMLFFSCDSDYKPYTKGSENLIVTVVEDSLWSEIEPLISSKVEKIIRTPQRERLFYFVQVPIEKFADYQYSKNIMLITTLDDTSKVSNFVRTALPEKGIKMVESKSRNFFNEYDKIAHRQNFMVLAANNKDELKSFLNTKGGKIFDCLRNGFIQRQFDQVYYKGEQVKLSERLFDDYGFSFRIPNDFEILEENKSGRIIQLGRANPDRWITIHWENGGFNKILDIKWAWKMRYWLGQNIMGGTYIEKQYITSRLVDWNGRSVNNMRGIWGHEEKTMGGPFSTFYFYDGVTNRTYFIDITMWAPGQDKNIILRQMELILSTFYTKK